MQARKEVPAVQLLSGSILGRIVSGSCLELMINIARSIALGRLEKEVRDELAALRAAKVKSAITSADIAWANKQRPFPHSHVMPRKAVNWCAELGIYVLQNWEPREGSASSNCENLVAARQAENIADLQEALEFQRKHPKSFDLNRHETRLIKRGDISASSLGYAETTQGTTNRNQAAGERFEAKQAWKQIPPTKSNCLRCEKVFQARKGTKYCSGNCRKRHFEQTQEARRGV